MCGVASIVSAPHAILKPSAMLFLEPLDDRGDLAAAAAGGFSAWSAATNIESADDAHPGADADFNTVGDEGYPFTSRDGKSFSTSPPETAPARTRSMTTTSGSRRVRASMIPGASRSTSARRAQRWELRRAEEPRLPGQQRRHRVQPLPAARARKRSRPLLLAEARHGSGGYLPESLARGSVRTARARPRREQRPGRRPAQRAAGRPRDLLLQQPSR